MGTSPLYSANSGTGDAEANRIILQAYTGETPTIVTNVSGAVHSDDAGAIIINHSYWTIDGITVNTTVGSVEFNSCIEIGYTNTAIGTKIINSNLNIVYATGTSNVNVIEIPSFASYTLIQNNTIRGYQWGGTGVGGIQLFGGNHNRILNNDIGTVSNGIYQKHPNCDSGLGTAEIAYNYIHNTVHGGIYGRFHYTNIHDNIASICNGGACFGANIGDDGGAVCNDGYAVINHNTFSGWGIKGVGMPNYIFTNNVVYSPGFYYDGSGSYPTSIDYNMYSSGYPTGYGPHDLRSTSPTFTGGSNPSTIAGFALTSGSAGHNAANDGTDMGANVSSVGPKAGSGTTPAAPVLY
jgi:hypothetical protein